MSAIDLSIAYLGMEFRWSVAKYSSQNSLPSLKVRKPDLREKKKAEITSPPERELAYYLSFFPFSGERGCYPL